MKEQVAQLKEGAHASNLALGPQSANPTGASASPPPFQLQASSLADLVSPVAALANSPAPLQLSSLNDYNDSEPDHDPSHVSDAAIRATDEYIHILHTHYLVPTTDPSILYTPNEILLACRLMLRAMREGTNVDARAQAVEYLNQARAQIGTAEKAESMEDDLSWSSTFPGVQNTDFGDWLLSNGAEPDPASGVMNCWELVMWSAYRAGFATKAGLANVYRAFAADLQNLSVPAAVANFETALRRGEEQVYDPNDSDSPRPLTGDIVIFNNLGDHVAVATGNTTGSGEVEIMSLWTQNSRSVYKTTIEELLRSSRGPIRFYSPNWR